jgi:hypothetical protein
MVGSLVPGVSLSLTASDTSANQLQTSWVLDQRYNQPSSLSLIAGTWGYLEGTSFTDLTIDASGNISQPQLTPGPSVCPLTGQISVVNATYNLYMFKLIIINCESEPHNVDYEGFVSLDTSVSPEELVGGGLFSTNSGVGAGPFLATRVGT